MILSELFLLFIICVQVQVRSEKIDFDRIFHSPKRNYDDMEILERSNFEPEDPKVDSKISTYNKDEPKAIANAQVLLNFPNRADVQNSHKGKQHLPVIESRSFEMPGLADQQHPKCCYPFPVFYPGPADQNRPYVFPKDFYHHYPCFYGAYYPPMMRPNTILPEHFMTTPILTSDYPTQFATSTPTEMPTPITTIAHNPCQIYQDLLEIIEKMSQHLLGQSTNCDIHFDNEERINIAEAMSIIVRYLNAKCSRCSTCLQNPNHGQPKELSIEVSLILEDILSMLPITLLQAQHGKLILSNQLNCLLDIVKYVRETFGHHRGLCELYKDIKDMFRPCVFLKDPSSTAYQSKANIRGYLLMDSLNLALYLAHRNKIVGDCAGTKEDIIDLWVDYLYKTQFLDCHETYGERVYPNIRKIEQLLVKLRKLFFCKYALGLRAKNPRIEGLDNLLEFCNTKPITFPPITNEINSPCGEKKHPDVLYELEKHNKLNLEELLSVVENYLKRKYNLDITKGDNRSTTTNPELSTLEPSCWTTNPKETTPNLQTSHGTINMGDIRPIYQPGNEKKVHWTPIEPINLGQVQPIYQHRKPITLGPVKPIGFDEGLTEEPFHEDNTINIGPVKPIHPSEPEEDCAEPIGTINVGQTAPLGPGTDPPTIEPVGALISTEPSNGEVDYTEAIEPISFGETAPLGLCTDENPPSIDPVGPVKPTHPPKPEDRTEPINFGPITPLEPCIYDPISPVKPTHPPKPEDHTEPTYPINFGPITPVEPCIYDPISPVKPTHPPKPEDHTKPTDPINFGPITPLEPCIYDPVSPVKQTYPPKPEDHTEPTDPINFGPITPVEPCIYDPISPVKPTHPPKPEDHTEPTDAINFGPITPLEPCIYDPVSPVKPTHPPKPEDHTEPTDPINFGPITPVEPCIYDPISPVKPTHPPKPEDHTEPTDPINFGPITPLEPCIYDPVSPVKQTHPPKPEDHTEPTDPINFGPITPVEPCIYDPISPVKPTHPPKPEDHTEPRDPINFGPITPLEPCIYNPISPVNPTHPPKPEDHTEPTDPINFGPISPLEPCIYDPISPVRPTHPPKPEDHTEPTDPINFGPISPLEPCIYDPISPVRPTHPPKPEGRTEPTDPINVGPVTPLEPCIYDPISPVKPTHPPRPEDHTEPTDPINFGPIAPIEQWTHRIPPKVEPVTAEPINLGQVDPINNTKPDPTCTEVERVLPVKPIDLGPTKPVYLDDCVHEGVTINPGYDFSEDAEGKRVLIKRPALIDEQVVNVSPCDMDFWPDQCNVTPLVKKPANVDEEVVNVSPCDMDFWPDRCKLTPLVKKPAPIDEQVVNVSPCDMDFWPDHCNLTPLVKKPAPVDEQIVNVSPCDMDFWPDRCKLTPLVKKPAPVDEQVVNVSPCDMDFWPDRCKLTPLVKKPAPIDEQVLNVSPCDMDFWPDHCNLSTSVKKSAAIDDDKIVDVKPCKNEQLPIGYCTEDREDKEIFTERPITKKPARIDNGKVVDVKSCNANSAGKTCPNDIVKEGSSCGNENRDCERCGQHVFEPDLMKPIEVIPIKLPSNQPIQLLCPDYLKHILSGNHQFILVPKIPEQCEKSPCEIPSNLLYGGIPGSKYDILKSSEPIPCLSCCNPGHGKINTDLDGLNPKMPDPGNPIPPCGNCEICSNGRRCPYCAPYIGELNY